MVGGRLALAAALATVPLTDDEHHLLELLEDGARGHDTLLTLEREAGVSPHAVIARYRDAMAAQAHLLLHSGLPATVEGILKQSVEGWAICPVCGGEGGPECESCLGKKRVWRTASTAHQTMVLESTKILPKGGGVQVGIVNHNANVGGGGAGDFFDKFVRATDDVAYDAAVEGEVVGSGAADRGSGDGGADSGAPRALRAGDTGDRPADGTE